jgi:hypothetical protein
MNKEIKITPESFLVKKNKTTKKAKKELIESLQALPKELKEPIEVPKESIESIEVPKSTESIEVPKDSSEKTPLYGCLKNGIKPTFRQSKNKTAKQYSSFGKTENIVRVLLKDKDTHAKIAKDKKKLDKHSMSDIRTYLKTRKLYKIGSTAPDDVLREIYKNAYLTGNVENNNKDTLVHNFLNDD